ncbi:hypothetical protein RR46_01378 [Papilio xuthus]|uniref:Uncharacterized protein n=1 Tax=Papilio xuthus TaxID=66420 RepID=A0A0N1I2W0_PAPXU|nr:hypothetical protein RR46_01378 [Papilio xuthus]
MYRGQWGSGIISIADWCPCFDGGAVENDAAVLLDVFKTCQNASSSERSACVAGLKTMICFRSHIYRLNWTPQFYRGPYENVLNGK